METLKYKIGIVFACIFMGFVIYMNSGNSKDIDSKELTLSNIAKVEIKRISDEKKIAFEDSVDFGPFIKEFLKSTETTINNTRVKGFYYVRIYFKNNYSELIGFKQSTKEGKYLFYKSSQFRNDQLFNKLDSIQFIK